MPAAVQGADEFARRDAHVVEEDAARRQRARADLVDRGVREALSLDVDHEHRQAVAARLAVGELLGARHHQHLRRVGHAGDPDLAAVQAPAAAVGLGLGFRIRAQLQRVGAGIGLGQRHAAVDLARDDLRQQLGLHRRRAEARQRDTAEDRVDHEELPDRRAAAAGGQRLHHQRQLEHAQASPADLGGQRGATQAGVADGAPELLGERLGGVLLAPVLEAEVVADLARRLDHLPLFIRESKIHRGLQCQS